jgi:phosphate:Na+ symporter
MASVVLLHIIGSVCLLLFGLHLVRSGVTRAFGVQLRKVIALSTSNRISAFFAGIGVSALLQSSMATTMIIASFAGQGMIGTAAALAVVLGADVGTTIIAQVMAFDMSWLSPILGVAGYFFYTRKNQTGSVHQVGRILIGLALMMLALFLTREASIPLKESKTLPLILQPLSQDPVLAVTVGVILTWVVHSSLAVVLLLVSLAHSGVIPVDLCLLMVLGANIGTVIPALIAALKDVPTAARIPSGNLIMRLVAVLIALPFMPDVLEYLKIVSDDPKYIIVNFHMAFNIFTALLFLPFLELVTKVVAKAVPDKEEKEDESKPKYLDDRVLETPTVALTNAAREALRIADMTDVMLQTAWDSFQKNDQALVEKAKLIDTTIDKLYKALKAYVVRVNQGMLTPEEAKRHFQILTFATNLEHIGDIIDRNLMPLAQKKIRGQTRFSPQGMVELNNLFRLVLDSVRLAQTVFISGDTRLARQLVEDKAVIKQAEMQASMSHLARLQQGIPETIATSDLHMDIIRDLRRINSLMASIAYPILEDAGELHRSLLKASPADAGNA